MAAACNTTPDAVTSGGVNAELIEAHIVAQAITELQEIQVPNNQGVLNTEDGVLTTEIQTDVAYQAEPGQTHVIYYIEDGSISRPQDRTLVDSSVQANDYDIERRSGKLPARKRVIPVKFRDYKNTSNDEDSDSDFDPHEYLGSRLRRNTNLKTEAEDSQDKPRRDRRVPVGRRGVGRPRKNFYPEQGTVQYVIEDTSEELERKFQEAIEASMQEMSQNQSVEQEMQADGQSTQQEWKTDPVCEADGEQSQNDGDRNDESQDDGEMSDNRTTHPSEQGHRMQTRGKRVTIPGLEPIVIRSSADGVSGARGRGRPRLTNLPYYKCTECFKTFKQKGNLKAHLRLHIVGNQFRCLVEGCDKSYRSNESLRRHLLTHQGIKPFPCDICEQRFSSNVSLMEHRSRHLDEKPYQCSVCNKCFRQISCFRRHMMTHSSELPYSCPMCDKKFSQQAYLKSHKKVHTGEKPFSCSVCGKRFAHQSDVKRHSTTHTGEKRYSCSKCQAKFSDVSSKNRHEREHENIKRYTCTLCNDSFKRIGQVRSHLNKKHSHTFAVKINDEQNRDRISLKVEDIDSNSVNSTQQRIVSIIKTLHTKAISGDSQLDTLPSQTLLPESVNQSNEMSTDHVADISQLEEVDASLLEGDIRVGVEVPGEENCQTFIAIADLAESLSVLEKESGDGQIRYKLLYEVDENGEQKQILVPYNPTEEETIQLEYNNLVPSTVTEDIVATETIIETGEGSHNLQMTDNDLTETGDAPDSIDNNSATNDLSDKSSVNSEVTTFMETKTLNTDGSVVSGIDFVNSPDFSKQEYYNWLTNFTEYCKVVPMPLDVSLFQKISQVHKTLSDVMATPFGVVAEKENFRVLMNISKELSTIINEHLVYVLQNLNDSEKNSECSA